MVELAQLKAEPDLKAPYSDRYTLGSNPAERARLRRQSNDLSEHAAALIARVGVRPGWKALDLGCGPSGALELLCERVGMTGRVTGLDFNPVHVAQARALARERRLENVEIMEGDARGHGPAGGFV